MTRRNRNQPGARGPDSRTSAPGPREAAATEAGGASNVTTHNLSGSEPLEIQTEDTTRGAPPTAAPPASRWRPAIAGLLATIVLASGLFVTVKRGILDLTLMFRHAPSLAHAPELDIAVSMVKARVPRGALIIYSMDQFEVWHFGMWKRVLYPDYHVVGVLGGSVLSDPKFVDIRRRFGVHYVLRAGPPLPGTRNSLPLPQAPHGLAMTLTELEN